MSQDAYSVAIQAVLKACQDGKPQHELWVPVCETPAYLVQHGFPQLPIAISARIVDKVHFEHGITKGMLERLPAMLGSPRALYRSASVDNAAVVLSFEQKGANSIIIALHADKQMGRAPQRANVVASIYDKRAEVMARWRQEGLLLWEATPAA